MPNHFGSRAELTTREGLAPASPGQRVAALEPAGALLALLEHQPGGRLRVLRVLRPVAGPDGLC